MKLLSIVNKIFKTDGENKTSLIALFLLGGIVLVTLSGLFKTSPKPKASEKSFEISEIRTSEEKRLEKLLNGINGVSKARVLISYDNNGITEALTEEKTVHRNSASSNEINNTELQTEKKPVFDGNKNIISKTQYMPKIKGVCIFYSGIKSEETEDKLYRAAKGALGAELHIIEVIHSD